MICSFECTFCAACVERLLLGVCPNCGGDFVPRPIRPARDMGGGNHLDAFPPSAFRRHRPVDVATHRLFAARVGEILPHQR